MSEEFWKHQFVAALLSLIRTKTGLGPNRAFELAYGETSKYWSDRGSYDNPEAAAEFAFAMLRKD